MITSKGVGFLAAAVVLFLLARLTQVGWLYLMDAVLWGMIALAAALPWLGIAFLAAHRRVESPPSQRSSIGPAEGEPVQISVRLRNRAPWPSYVLGLSYDCPVAAPGRRLLRFFVTHVARSGQVAMVSTVEAYQRGMHHLGPVVAESSAPFGLFRRRKRLTASHPVLVYPKVHALERFSFADGLSGTPPHTRKSRTGADPVGSRQYIFGDPRRLIHWRNTAKVGRLMVKELEDPVDRTLYLVFDATRVWGEGRETTLEYGIKVVASVAHYAHRNQMPVRVLGGGLGAAEGRPARDRPWHTSVPEHRLLKELAMVALGDGLGLAETLAHVPAGASALVAVSPADRPAMQAIARTSPMLHRLTVVSLEGFGEPEPGGEDLGALRAAKIPVVRCRPGGIREALQSLETAEGVSLSAAGPPGKGPHR